MPEDLKQFEAVFAEWEGLECRLVTIAFDVEDEKDALAVEEDLGLLEGRELIYLSNC